MGKLGSSKLGSTLITPDHGNLDGLLDDDHTQYALLAGRATGQTLIGGTASGDDLILQSTSNATKGDIILGSSAGFRFDEVNYRLSLGSALNEVPIAGVTIGARLVSVVDDGQATLKEAAFARHEDTVAGRGATIYGARSRGTAASPLIVENDDNIFDLYALGFDGTDYAQAACILMEVDGVPGSNDMPGRITFSTTPDGAQVPVEALRITSDGKLLTGGQTDGSDAQPGGMILDSQADASSSPALLFRSDRVDHGVTTLVNTNVWATFGKLSVDEGGLEIYSYGDTTRGIRVIAITETPNVGYEEGSVAQIRFIGSKSSGTGFTFIGDDDNIMCFSNYTKNKFFIRGSGCTVNRGGVQFFLETTTPTAIPEFGALYTKTDNELYFQDGAGDEHLMTHANDSYGEMYMYEASAPVTINIKEVYHAVLGFSTGSLEGFTFDAGRVVDANISAEANPSASVLRITTSGAHNLTTGDVVTQTAMNDAGHDGVTAITVVDATNYDCDDISYVAGAGASTGVVDEPSYLQAGAKAAGLYILHMSISGASAGAAKTFKWEIHKNASEVDTIVSERKHANTDIGSVGSAGVISVAANDRIWVACEGKTDTTNFSIEHANINLHRL